VRHATAFRPDVPMTKGIRGARCSAQGSCEAGTSCQGCTWRSLQALQPGRRGVGSGRRSSCRWDGVVTSTHHPGARGHGGRERSGSSREMHRCGRERFGCSHVRARCDREHAQGWPFQALVWSRVHPLFAAFTRPCGPERWICSYMWGPGGSRALARAPACQCGDHIDLPGAPDRSRAPAREALVATRAQKDANAPDRRCADEHNGHAVLR
jgi:hypothetical protein